MANINFNTPEGVQDILYESCTLKRKIEDGLRGLFRSYSYKEIETPTIEFLEVFSTIDKTFPPESMFKFFDEKGRLLVLKPDQTIPVARVVASKLRNFEDISKISYITNTYQFGQTEAGRQREYTQAGCELLNAPGVYADAEIIAIAINSILESGVNDFQIDIGQVGFFKGLMEESKLDDLMMEIIRELIDKKDYLGLEETLKNLDIEDDLKKQILNLPTYFGDIEIIENLKGIIKNEKALKSLERLEETFSILKKFGLDQYISFDLGMVQSINYYTGLIFKGYTYGIGFPVLNGGRYDNLLDNFGVSMSAVGFSIGINSLMKVITRQNGDLLKVSADTFITFDKECSGTAYKVAEVLRRQGLIVEFDFSPGDLEKAKGFSKKRGIPGLVYIRADETIEILNNVSNEISITSFEELTGGKI